MCMYWGETMPELPHINIDQVPCLGFTASDTLVCERSDSKLATIRHVFRTLRDLVLGQGGTCGNGVWGWNRWVALEGFRPLMHADNTERTFGQIGGRPRHQAVPEVRENKASETLAATDEAQAHVSKSTSISRLGCGCC
ncbi:hypothetical protein C0Q70_09238 [Pomacea canaliculata]|uniref:Uncharacterized protein n=1 Tax=Pomacea canaliculata TaxID=400727 RepID=A0A2T7P972_POMCA|nr:hypothetical protein C0Q70_09238 [Pomacea canaliculata]